MDDFYFEDFFVGQTFDSAEVTVSEPDIIAFGKKYADLPYHTDPEAARNSMWGSLVAPGYLTASLTFGMFVNTGVFRVCGLGSPGIDKLRWLKPVLAGDVLRMTAEVAEISSARDDKGRDAIRMSYRTFNQNDEIVLTLTSLHFAKRRPG
jgi:acyl dehydratase